MAKPLCVARLLLLGTAFIGTPLLAQGAPDNAAPTGPATAGQLPEEGADQAVGNATTPGEAGDAAQNADAPAEDAPADDADVSIPGGTGTEIVVQGRYTPNAVRATPEVVSVLSSADIARTGEGDIAGALGRVTGLSVVGNGFVYVRGLGDRYSLALLNGSPLPSPEPLRRVVPLDIFPTNVIASSLVQKSYSANFPGEFGGGVINLTTKAIPRESFVTISGGISGDSETTDQLGYVYYGGQEDWTGFDNGARKLTPALADFFASGNRIGDGTVDTQELAKGIVTGRKGVLQRNRHIPANWSATLSGGTKFDLGGADFGVIATAGYSNKWRTRSTLQQTPASQDLSQTDRSFQRVITDDRIVVNGLLGFGLEFGENQLRWTNLYIRDTIKQGSLGLGTDNTTRTGADFLQQSTAWYERQLIDTQLVGEFKLGGLGIDVRGAYANSQREAPYELDFGYSRSNLPGDPFRDQFINRLDNGQTGFARAAFSDLNEDLYAGGIDLNYEVLPRVKATVGYAYNDTKRRSERREFQFTAPGGLPSAVALFRPDLLLGPAIIDYYGVTLTETTETDPAFSARLRTHAGYGQVEAELAKGLNINIGVRYEDGEQSVTPVQVFTTPSNSNAFTNIRRNYWLPAGTITWEFLPEMQLRANASKTLARPQFRELIFQSYYDPETNRAFRGNPLLTDSVLYNGELRYEWYFAREQRLSVAGFYKKIDRPIEAFTGFTDNNPETSFANAPEAQLYGAEVEAQKYFYLDKLSDLPGLADRRLVLVANYTYTKSKLKVGANDTVDVFGTTTQPASNFFIDGSPLTGQSNHLVNLQLGLENTERLSQQTFLLTYASKRVTSRGAAGLPDIIENPGLRLDFVMREGIRLFGVDTEAKLEVRNITGRDYREYQERGDNRIYYNRYDVGTSFAFGLGVTF